MNLPPTFTLEDFHGKFEHRPGLINLATSDARYWTLKELTARFPELRKRLGALELSYPDSGTLAKTLEKHFSRLVADGVVLPTAGAGEAIFLALAAIGFGLPPSKVRIAIPRPAFGAFDGLSQTFGYEVVHYDYLPDEGWNLDTKRFLQCARTCDAMVVNSPHNPTGAIVAAELMEEAARLLDSRGKYLIADEAFVLPNGRAPKKPARGNALVIGTLSKMFGLPGLRLGWLVAPRALGQQLTTLQQYTTLSLNSFAATLGTTLLPQMKVLSRGAEVARNRRLLLSWAKRNADKVRLGPCAGGTTTVLEIHSAESEDAWFQRFLEAKVLLAPGSCFGVQGPRPWFRVGYARDTAQLKQALATIERVIAAALE